MKRSTEVPPGSPPSGDANALDDLLRHAREDGFTPEESEKLWSQLGAAMRTSGRTDGSGAPARGQATRALSASSAKTIAVLALGGVIVTGAVAATRTNRLAAYTAAASPSHTEGAEVGGPGSRPVVESGGVGASSSAKPNARIDLPESIPASPPISNPAPRAPAPRRSVPKAGQPQPLASASASAGSTESLEGEKAPPGPAPTAEPRASASAHIVTERPPEGSHVPVAAQSPPGPAPAEPPRAPPSAEAVNEGALLLRARRELGANPNQTLELTEKHARLFPAGTLVPEREVLAIEALAQLGRTSDARARFAGLCARFPNSPHLTRLQAMLGR